MALADRRTFTDAPTTHLGGRMGERHGYGAGTAEGMPRVPKARRQLPASDPGSRDPRTPTLDSGAAPVPSFWQSTRSAASYLMVGVPFGLGLLTLCRWIAEVIA